MYAFYCFWRQQQLPKVLNRYIHTRCMNKRGFHCALTLCRFSLSRSSIFLFFSPPYYPGSLRIFPLFFHVPSQVSNLSHSSSLPVLLLHQYNGRFSWELPLKKTFFYFSLNDLWITPRKIVFILLDSLTFQKIYVTIYLFICLTHASRCTKTRTGLFNQLGPWWVSFLLGSVDKLTRCNNGRPPVSAKLTPFLTL